ncbi:hypothetical protein ACFZDI_19510 [Streptomyces sp. NPDC007907]|uniref:hypothetical protein n=1 Tax=Streptomyces sp. NPDC007907 TaxID=3364789 RepID=UPI0036EF40D2
MPSPARWFTTRAHYLRWDGAARVSERRPVAATPVVMKRPGEGAGSGRYWAVGPASTSASSTALPRIER